MSSSGSNQRSCSYSTVELVAFAKFTAHCSVQYSTCEKVLYREREMLGSTEAKFCVIGDSERGILSGEPKEEEQHSLYNGFTSAFVDRYKLREALA